MNEFQFQRQRHQLKKVPSAADEVMSGGYDKSLRGRFLLLLFLVYISAGVSILIDRVITSNPIFN